MVRRAHANGDIYLGHVRGLVLPERGLPQRHRRHRDRARDHLPEPSRRPAPVADRAELVLPPVRLPGAPRAPLRRPSGVRPARLPTQRDARVHPRRPRGLLDQPRTDAGRLGHPVPDRRGRRRRAQLEDGSWDPEAGKIYVWYDALINYITGAGFPDDPEAFAHWWPADLHVIGKDITRFHTIFWPAMLWSAGLEAPRQVWVHGFLLAAGGERMSKSRGNFLDPDDFVAAFGAGRRPLRRRCARCRSTATPRSRGTRSSAATTPTSPTTSATSSTGP